MKSFPNPRQESAWFGKNNLFWGQLMVSLMSPTELAMPTKLQCRAGEGESILLVVNGWREANGEDCHPKIEVFFL